jgi:alpha-ribazole phosphatase
LLRRSTATFWSSSAEGQATRILLVRHGRVAWNARSAYTGWTDIELDDWGLQEAGMVSKKLSSAPIKAVYSSDLIRARKTAEIIAKPHGLTVTNDKNLREINYGEWEGLGVDDIIANYGEDFYKTWTNDPENVRIPGGETFSELCQRAAPAAESIAKAHPGQTVVIVAHKSVNRVLLCHWLGLSVGSYKQIEQDNGAINSVVFSGNRVVVETVNDVCHIVNKAAVSHLT